MKGKVGISSDEDFLPGSVLELFQGLRLRISRFRALGFRRLGLWAAGFRLSMSLERYLGFVPSPNKQGAHSIVEARMKRTVSSPKTQVPMNSEESIPKCLLLSFNVMSALQTKLVRFRVVPRLSWFLTQCSVRASRTVCSRRPESRMIQTGWHRGEVGKRRD